MFELEPNLLSKSIFNKNQKENENLAIYFWLNEDKREILDPSLVRACAEAEAGIRYNHIQHCYDMYLKRNEGTTKSWAQYQEEFRVRVLGEVIRTGFLGTAIKNPVANAFNLRKLTSDIHIFLGYICTKRNADGSLLKPEVYREVFSSLIYLFDRYDFEPPGDYYGDLSSAMVGVARIAKKQQEVMADEEMVCIRGGHSMGRNGDVYIMHGPDEMV